MLEQDKIPTKPNQNLFIKYLLKGYPIKEAGLKAGYTNNSARMTLPHAVKHNPNLQKKILKAANGQVEYHRALYQLNLLPRLLNVHDKALDVYESDPNKALDKPKTLETIAKIAGLMGPEIIGQVNNYVQINQIQAHMHDHNRNKWESDSLDIEYDNVSE
jgi:hypothetical protein